MGKKKHRPPKRGPVWKLSAEEATMLRKPLYNGHMCGTGMHGSKKYDRNAAKRQFNESLRNGGSFSFGPQRRAESLRNTRPPLDPRAAGTVTEAKETISCTMG